MPSFHIRVTGTAPVEGSYDIEAPSFNQAVQKAQTMVEQEHQPDWSVMPGYVASDVEVMADEQSDTGNAMTPDPTIDQTPRQKHLAYLRLIVHEMDALLDNHNLSAQARHDQIFSDAIEGEIIRHTAPLGVSVEYHSLFNDEPITMAQEYVLAVHKALDPIFPSK